MNKKIIIALFFSFLMINGSFFVLYTLSEAHNSNITNKNINSLIDNKNINSLIDNKTVNSYITEKYSIPTGSTDIKLCQNGYGIYKNPNGYVYYFNISSGKSINTTTTNSGYNNMNYLYINGNTKYYIWVCSEPTSSTTAQFKEINLNNNIITKITGGALPSADDDRSHLTKSNLFGDLLFYGICYAGVSVLDIYGDILLNVFNLSSQTNTYYTQKSYVLENDSSCYYYGGLNDNYSGNNFIGRFTQRNQNYFIISYNVYGFQHYFLKGNIAYAGNSYIFNNSINSFTVNNENYLFSHNTCIYNSIDKINFTTKKVITYSLIPQYPNYRFSELNVKNFYYNGSKIITNVEKFNLSISSPNQILFCKTLFYYNINAIINYQYFINNILNINAENHLSQSVKAYFYYNNIFYYGLNFTFKFQSLPINFRVLNYSIFSTNNTNILIQQSNYTYHINFIYYYNYTIIYNSVKPTNANPLNINEYLQPLTYIFLILSMIAITIFVIKNNRKMMRSVI
jgi:hypothetical protein